MYERDTILTLKTPKWRKVIDNEPGDWIAEGFDVFEEDHARYLAELSTYQGDPRHAPTPALPDGEVFPYNEVRVAGASPVSHADRGGWSGAGAAGVIIEPLTSFGSVLDEPLGKLQALYDVKSLPAPTVVNPMSTRAPLDNATVTQTRSTETPEDVFRREAPGDAPKDGQRRARTPHGSPLTAPSKSTPTSPLDD